MKTRSLIKSDIIAVYSTISFKTLIKSFFNPSIHACVLTRLVRSKNKVFSAIIRNLLISKHSIDISSTAIIGPALRLPHPIGIVIGDNAVLHGNITIYQNSTIGSKNGYPEIGNNTIIYPNSVIVGPINVGEHCVIGAGSFLDKSLTANTVFHR
ncbi:DapH/DapD/GlmU-related protein [Pseudomonas sp. GW101-3H06]|jgi:serine O-acetyltransferase|uniref:serine O-acetyltransferase n=1 Tax=Pseudomonas TaxID=286 RepID=UPI001A911B4B